MNQIMLFLDHMPPRSSAIDPDAKAVILAFLGGLFLFILTVIITVVRTSRKKDREEMEEEYQRRIEEDKSDGSADL